MSGTALKSSRVNSEALAANNDASNTIDCRSQKRCRPYHRGSVDVRQHRFGRWCFHWGDSKTAAASWTMTVMPISSRRAFTIVELLVVVGVIAILMGLMVPALLQARAAARRTQCLSNMRQVGQSLLGRTMANAGYFPSYKNKLELNADHPLAKKHRIDHIPVGWVAKILPELGRSDIINETVDNDRDSGFSYTGSSNHYLPIVVCPLDIPEGHYAPVLSYVVNCGIADQNENGQPSHFVPDSRANGVFHNLNLPRNAFPHAYAAMRTSVDYIAAHDGTGMTLMVSENVDATVWDSDHEFDTGFLWSDSHGNPVHGINEKANEVASALTVSQSTHNKSWPEFARPSSFHTSGVNAVFCDGRGVFLGDDIEYWVYAQLMTPHGKKAMIDVTKKVVAPSEYRRFVSASDYQ